jgi:hypothetical protein
MKRTVEIAGGGIAGLTCPNCNPAWAAESGALRVGGLDIAAQNLPGTYYKDAGRGLCRQHGPSPRPTQRQFGISCAAAGARLVHVTHSQDEALALADLVIVMNATGLAFAQKGWRVRVHEQESALRILGAGI